MLSALYVLIAEDGVYGRGLSRSAGAPEDSRGGEARAGGSRHHAARPHLRGLPGNTELSLVNTLQY